MSIPVRLSDLVTTLAEYGAGYLLTTDGGRVKAVTVDAVGADGVSSDGALALPGSRGSAANLVEHPDATLLFPPTQPRGYTLIVDGTASGDADAIRFLPSSAVLHRPSSHADGPPAPGGAAAGPAEGESGCGHDCRPVQ